MDENFKSIMQYPDYQGMRFIDSPDVSDLMFDEYTITNWNSISESRKIWYQVIATSTY